MKRNFLGILLCLCTALGAWAEVTIGNIKYEFDAENKTACVVGYYGNPTKITIQKRVGYENVSYVVTSIGEGAFDGCSGLKSITLPESVTSIGNHAFGYCAGLTGIQVNKNNPCYCSVDGILYTKDMDGIISYPAGKSESSFIIPESVTSIGNSAFYSCLNLTGITIPEGSGTKPSMVVSASRALPSRRE